MSKSLAIIIPAYKPTYLRATLESLAAQTCRDFKVYVGDDKSPHGIEPLVREFAGILDIEYKRFDENLGGRDLVAQWERCIAMSEDEPYIWLFSDDDVMQPGCVEAFLNTPEEIRDNYLCHFNIAMIDDLNGGRVVQLAEFPQVMTAGEFLEAKLRGRVVSYVVECVFSRKLYREVGGFQNFDLAWGADFMTWLKMASMSKGIYTPAVADKVLWRKSDENISPDMSRPVLLRKLNSWIENAAFIKGMFENNPQALKPLKRSFRWLRFPLGEIYRNRTVLNAEDVRELLHNYRRKVGYPLQTALAGMLVKLKK